MKRKPTLAEATISEERGVRYLHLGTPWIQGAMRIRQPQKLELEYIQRMMAWLLLRDPEQLPGTRCLQLGLGAAAITKYCHSVLRLPTTAVEINPQVIGVCRSWFHLPEDDERLTVVQADAARYVASDDQVASFDALSVDLYDHEAAAPVLDSPDFYADCRNLLTDEGCMTVNLFGRDASYERSVESIRAAFGADAIWAFKPTRDGNAIVLAQRTPTHPTRMELLARAEVVQERWGLPATKWLKVFKPAQP